MTTTGNRAELTESSDDTRRGPCKWCREEVRSDSVDSAYHVASGSVWCVGWRITDVFDRMAEDPRYLGFGYIGGREQAPNDSALAEADQRIISIANAKGWDYERLFEWANSKPGRWFADAAFGCDDLERAVRHGEL